MTMIPGDLSIQSLLREQRLCPVDAAPALIPRLNCCVFCSFPKTLAISLYLFTSLLLLLVDTVAFHPSEKSPSFLKDQPPFSVRSCPKARTPHLAGGAVEPAMGSRGYFWENQSL
jgi:hypothetical protein